MDKSFSDWLFKQIYPHRTNMSELNDEQYAKFKSLSREGTMLAIESIAEDESILLRMSECIRVNDASEPLRTKLSRMLKTAAKRARRMK